jgi:hypothetical protein
MIRHAPHVLSAGKVMQKLGLQADVHGPAPHAHCAKVSQASLLFPGPQGMPPLV